MRIVLGLLVLFALFGAAVLWQTNLLDGFRDERARPADSSSLEALPDPPPGWGRVVVGRPSGAESLPPETAIDEDPEREADIELYVRRGERLWTLAEEIYGRATPTIVEGLASYNSLENPDQLQDGQRLYFPPLEVLEGGS